MKLEKEFLVENVDWGTSGMKPTSRVEGRITSLGKQKGSKAMTGH